MIVLEGSEQLSVAISSRMSRGEDIDEQVRQRSGWLIPIGVFAVTAVLSAIVLLYYLAPTPASFIEEHPSPTARSDIIPVSVNGLSFKIPANYILYKSARQGGAHRQISLVTLFPEFHGYSDWDGQTFASDAPDSPVVYLLIREDPLNLTEEERLKRIYLNLVSDPAGTPGPFGLKEYSFRDDSGYRGESLFVGGSADHPVVLICDRFSQQVRSPYCLRDLRLKRGVAVNYRFKRTLLANWRQIADGVDELIRTFRAHGK
jgi:hypothetical protein